MPNPILPAFRNQEQIDWMFRNYPEYSRRRDLRVGSILEETFSRDIARTLVAQYQHVGKRVLKKWWTVDEMNLPP